MTTSIPRHGRVMVWLMLSALVPWCAWAQVTESPITVAPGKVLVEMDGISLEVDRDDPNHDKFHAVGVASTLVTTGITRDLDVQVGFDLFHRETIEIRGARESHSGLGDVRVRAKYTFWRDEDWGAAAAVIPYVKVPTSSGGIGNDSVDGGFIVPWSMDLGAGFVPGAMFQWDVVRNDADNGYDSRWSVSGYVERALLLGINAYAEAVLQADSGGSSRSAGQLGAGARWKLTDHVELDYELLKGLNARASDWTHVFRVNWDW